MGRLTTFVRRRRIKQISTKYQARLKDFPPGAAASSFTSAAITATDHKLEGGSDERIVSDIRALAALAVFASVTALTTQASATISNPTIEQRMLVGTDIVIPIDTHHHQFETALRSFSATGS